MDPLREWHEYVDGLSRAARRLAPDEVEPPRWRPWLDPPAPESVSEELLPAAMPDLLPSLNLPGMSLHQRTTEYEDPTLDDALQPMREFEAPTLRAPGFDVAAPPLAATKVPAASSSPADSDTLAGEHPTSGVPPQQEVPGEDRGEPVPPGKRWELLAQIRAETAPHAGGKPRIRESREDLAHRVLDPTLTLEETALFLGVCATTVRRYTNRGLLRHFRTQGNQRRFRLSDVVEFLESRSTEIEADARADEAAGRGKPVPDDGPP